MSRIRGTHTAPERAVRVILRALGIRYRLHPKGLTGRLSKDSPCGSRDHKVGYVV